MRWAPLLQFLAVWLALLAVEIGGAYTPGPNDLFHCVERIWQWKVYNIAVDVYGADEQKIILPFTKAGGAETKNNRGSGEGERLTYNEFMQRTVDGLLDPESKPRIDLGLTEPDPSKGSADLDRAAVDLYNLKDDRFKQISKPRILNNDQVNRLGTGNTYPRLMRGISDLVNEWRMQEETGKGETWKKVKPHVDDLTHLSKTISDGRRETTAGSYIPDLMMRGRKTDKGVYIGGLGLQEGGGQVSFRKATKSKLPESLSEVLGRSTFQEVNLKKTWSENKAILKAEPNNFNDRHSFANWANNIGKDGGNPAVPYAETARTHHFVQSTFERIHADTERTPKELVAKQEKDKQNNC